jgi:aminoglycoside phosphotransferase (APT) family kinase protein
MPSLDPGLLEWAVRAAAPGAEVAEVRGLRDGGSPWLVRLGRGGGGRGVVLRVGGDRDRSALGTEVAALRLAAEHRLPAPRLLAAELDGDPPVVLVERLEGSSAIPPDRPPARLRTLGRAAAALRRRPPVRPLLLEAEARVAGPRPGEADVFVHGDLWQGNALWLGDTLTGLVDWDCAGAGPPGVDLGSLRCDAAVCFGLEAADDVLAGWEELAGRPAADVAHWDVVAALSTPPDMGWFVGAIAGQGRPDLSQDVLVRRRDAFLRAALGRLDGRAG